MIICLAGSIIGGIVYRMGGTSLGTKWRDLGLPAVFCLTLWLLGLKLGYATGAGLAISFGLLFGALTTYWKKKGEDAKWYHWLLTGFFYALAALPLAIVTRRFLGFGIRLIILPILTMLWSEWIGDVNFEEGGRGFLIIATSPLLFI